MRLWEEGPLAHVWLGTQGKAELGQSQGTFGIHLERGPGGIFWQVVEGRREAESASFSSGSVDQLARRVRGCTSESFLELLQRGWRTGGENWLARRREGQAHGGRGAWGGGGRSPGRGGAGRSAASQPSLLAGLWFGGCFASARRWLEELPPDRPQCYIRGLGGIRGALPLTLRAPRGRGPLQMCLPACKTSASLLLQPPQKSPILLHPGPQPAQDRTFVPCGHPRNPFSGCDATTPFPCI